MEKENIIIIPGKCTKSDLVNKISNSFWEEYNEFTFKFVDESIVKDYRIG